MKPSRAARKANRQLPVASTTPTADSFHNAAARLGYGANNLLSGSTYAYSTASRNRQQLDNAYDSNWVVGRAVDCVAEDMTMRGVEVHSSADPSEIEALTAEWQRLKIWSSICDAIRWSRLYGGSVAVLLIDGQDMSQPLRPDTIGRGQFKGLAVLDRWQLSPSQSDLVKALGPELGLPKFYDVVNDYNALAGSRIHHSRVIRIEGQQLPFYRKQAEMGWGVSVLERLWDRLVAYDSATMGTAQLVYRAHLRTMKIKGLRDIIAAGGPALEGLVKQIDFMRATQSNEGVSVLDGEDEFDTATYTFAGLSDVLLQLAQQLSGSLQIPLTKLLGQSPAGLNSTGESDLENYYSGIEQQQETKLRSGITKLIDVSWRSLHGAPPPEGTTFTFNPLWQLSDKERTEIAKTTTDTVTAAVEKSLVKKSTGLKELRQASRTSGTWTNISDEEIAAAEKQEAEAAAIPASESDSAQVDEEQAA
jgi:phage-related protein (TIGR01555 family)